MSLKRKIRAYQRRQAASPPRDRERAFALYAEGRMTEALAVANQVMAREKPDPYLLNLAAVCHGASGHPGLALSCWQQALALQPDYADAYGNMGNMFKDIQRYPEAEACYRQALSLQPDHVEANNNLGVLLHGLNRHEEAAAAYEEILRHHPNHVGACFNLGNAFYDMKRWSEAETAYRQALRMNPDHADACNNLGLLLQESGRGAEGEILFRQTLRLKPDHADVHYNLGNLLTHYKRPKDAEIHYRRALTLKPHHAKACNNLAILLQHLKRFPEAAAQYRQALHIRPDYADAQWNLGLLYLSLGNFPEGWPLYEARYDPGMEKRNTIPIEAPFPMWRGEDLTGKSLLIIPEQGIGDQIQFCRYGTILKTMGAKHITLVCDSALKELFQSLAGVDQVLEKQSSAPLHYDFWTFTLSIPLRLHTEISTIPAQVPYLYPPPKRLAHWHQMLPKEGFRVGLAWKGNPNHSNDSSRSLTSLHVLAPLWRVAGVVFISLQKGRGEEEAIQPPPLQPIHQFSPLIHDFADTAAMVAHMDLVISIDSAVAHLAGAMGKPCWIILPTWGTDWRWLQERSDSPWYPGTRLFRQRHIDDWSEVVQHMADELAVKTTGTHG
ncbi:MAG: hypothetical protein HW380_3761 [Magnetococcales bacterium]|nr:hypothetical protein [Magnetococcales bacterium]